MSLYVHNDLALYIFTLSRSRILAYWLMLSVVKTTINKGSRFLSYITFISLDLSYSAYTVTKQLTTVES